MNTTTTTNTYWPLSLSRVCYIAVIYPVSVSEDYSNCLDTSKCVFVAETIQRKSENMKVNL